MKKKHCEKKKEYDGKCMHINITKNRVNVTMHSLVKNKSKKDILLCKSQRLDSCVSVHDKVINVQLY